MPSVLAFTRPFSTPSRGAAAKRFPSPPQETGTLSPITHYWTATFVKLHKAAAWRGSVDPWRGVRGALLLSLSNLFVFLWVLLWLTRSALAQTWSTVDELFMLSSAHWFKIHGKKKKKELERGNAAASEKGLTNGDSAKDTLSFEHLFQSLMCLIWREESPAMIWGLGFSLQRQQEAASSDPLKCHGFNWLQRATNGKIKIKSTFCGQITFQLLF